jgi:hypothetical protein
MGAATMLVFRTLVLAAALLMSCTPSTPPEAAGSQVREPSPPDDRFDAEDARDVGQRVIPPVTTAMQTLRATLTIDEQPGGKKFQGVWLDADDGIRRVISYRADPWWQPFDGLRVEAKGRSYAPKGQAISAAHFRVEELRIIDPAPDHALVFISGERELMGSFASVTWPEGTKLAGETRRVFHSDHGVAYELYRLPDPAPASDQSLRITARVVEPSPFAGRPGGSWLWVMNVTPVE